jgi:PKD repeat protein
MNRSLFHRSSLALLAAVVVAGCTMAKEEAPSLTGPSEFANSIDLSISPDILTQDGGSQSTVTVVARGPNGATMSNLPLRAQIFVDGTATDFGSLSARNLVTDAQGRATLVYTAPASIPGIATFTTVEIGVTPVGTNFGNSSTRTASLRLIPPGGVIAGGNFLARISGPEQANDNELVVLSAQACAFESGTTECLPPPASIISYVWDLGDGRTATGPTVTHTFTRVGTFLVRVTITDAQGRAASGSRSISVVRGTAPTATFNVSPAAPRPGQPAFFNASAAAPAPGRRIVSYRWVFGDGTTSDEGPTTSHVYGTVGDYNVTLTVTDDAGRTQTSAPTLVKVANP